MASDTKIQLSCQIAENTFRRGGETMHFAYPCGPVGDLFLFYLFFCLQFYTNHSSIKRKAEIERIKAKVRKKK